VKRNTKPRIGIEFGIPDLMEVFFNHPEALLQEGAGKRSGKRFL
jgi:hypothetical protein